MKERFIMDSILVFWNQMTANPLLFIAVTLTPGVILVNGWTDAPNAIAKAFVTPIDREDLDLLSHELDSVTDGIEDILQKIYINNITEIEPAAIEFAKKIVLSCECLCEIMEEFENFKKSKKLHDLIVKLNDVEEECDKLYLAAARQLMKNPKDTLTALSWREIFDSLESCVDDCEEVSESIASVIMKNT